MGEKQELIIGVLGGMGTNATIHLFKQYADIFPAQKEWDRPRIIIDNRCTMPSRVRAFLYKENIDKLVLEMTDSLQNLVNSGCNKIILACNTSHLFLPYIYNNNPELEKYIIDIIKNCVKKILEDKNDKAFLLASEGTIDSKIYQKELEKYSINCIVPQKEEYSKLRECIEAVKQNNFTETTEHLFLELINRYDTCILGCTELPILYEKYKEKIKCKRVYDPLNLCLLKLKREFGYE